MVILKINNAINYVLQFKKKIAQLKFEFKENFLKIHIKASFSIVFSPMIDDGHSGEILHHF